MTRTKREANTVEGSLGGLWRFWGCSARLAAVALPSAAGASAHLLVLRRVQEVYGNPRALEDLQTAAELKTATWKTF